MPSVLAAFAVDLHRPATIGLREKAFGLVNAARAAGHDVTAALPTGTALQVFEPHDRMIVNSIRATHHLPAALYRFSKFWHDLRRYVSERSYDYVWTRAHPISRWQLSFIQTAHATGAGVVYDIPTYPFENERSGVYHRMAGRLCYGLGDIGPFTDRFVTLSEHVSIEGRPTVRVRNGVTVPARARPIEVHSGPYRLLGLGQWSHYHGVDRLFAAVAATPADYVVRLAGQGPAVPSLIRLAKRLSLRVEWLPPTFGPSRDRQLAWADMGIGSLAIHRKGVYPDQALKHRVYAAAGLPFVASTADPLWEGHPGVWRVPCDESGIAQDSLRRQLELFRERAGELASPLRSTARSASWDQAYAPLFDYFDHRS